MQQFLVTWLASIPPMAAPYALAALGLIVSERSGVLNLTAEGLMLVGALTGVGALLSLDVPPWAAMLIGAAAAAKRDEAFVDAAETVSGPGFATLALSLAAWAEEADRRPRLIGDARLDRPIERLAPDLVEALAAKARKRAAKAKNGDPEALHGLRKALKKLRYGLEFLDGVYSPPEKTLKRLKARLDRLGALNDGATAAKLAAGLAGEQAALGPAAVAFGLRRERLWRDDAGAAARKGGRALKGLG